MGSPKEVLIRARKLIEKPENWTQGVFYGPGGYCAAGALLALGEQVNSNSASYRALQKAMGLSGGQKICFWNDRHTHAEVLAAFDRAIESA